MVVLRFDVNGNPTWHAQRIDKPLQDAIAAAYRPAGLYGDYYLYVPK